MTAVTAAMTSSRPGASFELNRRFAVAVATAMFVVNFAGFVPTFFLRPWFDVPEIPALVVHDLWTRRRVHLATIFGLVFFLGVNFAFQSSGVGQAIVAYRRAHL